MAMPATRTRTPTDTTVCREMFTSNSEGSRKTGGREGREGRRGGKGEGNCPFRPSSRSRPCCVLELRPEPELQHARRVGGRRARVRLTESRVLLVQREQRRVVVLPIEHVEHFEDPIELDFLRERNPLLQPHVDAMDRRKIDSVARN